MKRLLFILMLSGITFTLVFSLVKTRIINRTFHLYYLKDTSSEGLCYENMVMDQSRFTKEEILFTGLNNMISGPQNIFMDSLFTQPLSIRKVLLMDNTLIVDFNRFLTSIDEKEERILLTVFAQALTTDFPKIEEMVWLSEGRQVPYITGWYPYTYPIRIKHLILNNNLLHSIPEAIPSC